MQGKYPVREVRGRRERSDVPTEFIARNSLNILSDFIEPSVIIWVMRLI